MEHARWLKIKEIFWAASELPTSARADYLRDACGTDGALRQAIEALLASHAVDDAFIAEPALQLATAVPLIGRRLGHYRVVAELGQGGMSDVYRGVRDDDEFHKDVAIKVIRRGYGLESLLEHFRTEKQILATLDHPNIARLLDAGSTDDGQPYLVMDFIEGRVIDEYCSAHRLGLARRLALFRSLCTAVQYVHRHLMVHGDLKCSNVLITEDGEVKLLDFGIARLVKSPLPEPVAQATGQRMLLLTPEYASPEQLRGAPVTTATDVYSLGVMLFRLLSGVLPRRSVQGQINADCARSEAPFEQPSELARRSGDPAIAQFSAAVSGDLDCIVQRALHADPLQRYASVEQLHEDVRRHLESIPISARPATIPYTLGRFARRHTTGIAVAVVLVCILLGGIAATSWEAHVADVQRARAERHFDDVRRLANTFLFDVEEAIEKLPGSTAARQLLVDNSLKYLDGLSREAASNVLLQRELAAAYEKVADIQGGFRQANLGNTRGAIAAYRQAIAIRTRLMAAAPATQELRREQLRNYGKLVELLGDTGDVKTAVEASAQLLEEARKLGSGPQADDSDRRFLGNALMTHGWTIGKFNDATAGLAEIDQAIEIYAALIARDSGDRRSLHNLALAYDRAAEILVESTRDYERALQMRVKGLEITRNLAAADPHNSDLKKMAGYALLGMGDALRGMGSAPQALQRFDEGTHLLRELFESDARNDEARYDLAFALGQSSDLLAAGGDLDSAQRALDEALRVLLPDGAAPQAPGPDLDRADVELATDYHRLGRLRVLRALALGATAAERARHCRQAKSWFDKGAPVLSAAILDDRWRTQTEDRLARAAGEFERCEFSEARAQNRD